MSRTANDVDFSRSDRQTIKFILSTNQVNKRLYKAFDIASLENGKICQNVVFKGENAG